MFDSGIHKKTKNEMLQIVINLLSKTILMKLLLLFLVWTNGINEFVHKQVLQILSETFDIAFKA